MVRQLTSRLARGSSEAGFTLLEMLVAVAVLAVLASLIPRGFVSARALIDRSDAWLEAQLVADAVLKDELAGSAMHPGTFRGRKAGHEWSATILPDTTLHAEL